MTRRGAHCDRPDGACVPIGAIDVGQSLMRRAPIAVLLLTELFEN